MKSNSTTVLSLLKIGLFTLCFLDSDPAAKKFFHVAGGGGRSLCYNRWVAGSNPRFVRLSCWVFGQDTSPALSGGGA